MSEIKDTSIKVAFGPMLTSNTLKYTKALELYKGQEVSAWSMIVTRNLIELDCAIAPINEMVKLAEMVGLKEGEIAHIYTTLDSAIPMLQELKMRLKALLPSHFFQEQTINDDGEQSDEWDR